MSASIYTTSKMAWMSVLLLLIVAVMTGCDGPDAESSDPPTAVGETTPDEVIDAPEPGEIVGQASPGKTIDASEPTEPADRNPSAATSDVPEPAEDAGQNPPEEIADTPAPKETVEQAPPDETTDAPKPTETAGKTSPDKTTSRQEPLFVDWPEPDYVLFVTGRQHGYIEPCGCTGLTNQKGGLVRRYSLNKQLKDRGWKVVAVDVGNQVKRFGRQPEIKFQRTIDALNQMKYDAIGLGPDDLRLSTGELIAVAVGDGETPSSFVCANTVIVDPSLTPRYQIVDVDGKKVGVTAILGETEQAMIVNDEIIKQKPLEALEAVWPELEKADCDLYVLLSHTSIEDTIKLVQQFPKWDVVVTAGGAGEPTYQPEKIEGTDAIMVQVGTKGMYVGVVGVFNEGEPRLRYQRVPLDARFPDSREMLDLLKSYQENLKVAGLEGLGVKPIPHPSGDKFVGSAACEDCHEDEYEIWEDTPHSFALDSLVHPGERSEIPRHFDPECVSCHVVGWNPQKYFPYVSGYLGLEETPLMHNVGCENCHGPGGKHVDAESGFTDADDELLEKLREAMRLPLEQAEKKCMDCHDLDNSPDFHVKGAFEEYWEQVEH